MNWTPFIAKLIIFGITIQLSTILYIFSGIGGFALIVYLLNLLFRKNRQRKEINYDSPEYIRRLDFERDKNNLDNEILSVLKHRKERDR